MSTLYLGDFAKQLTSTELRVLLDQYGLTVTLDDESDPERPLYQVSSEDFDVTIITDTGSYDDKHLREKVSRS